MEYRPIQTPHSSFGTLRARALVLALTATGLLLSATACWLLFAGQYTAAFILVLVALLFDELDGYLARRLGATTQTGAWLDAVADVFTFLVFPLTYWSQTLPLSPVVLAVVFGAGVSRLIRHAARGYQLQGRALAFTGVPCSALHVLLGFTLAVPLPASALEVLLILLSISLVSWLRIPKPPIQYPILGLLLYLTVVVWRSAVGF